MTIRHKIYKEVMQKKYLYITVTLSYNIYCTYRFVVTDTCIVSFVLNSIQPLFLMSI